MKLNKEFAEWLNNKNVIVGNEEYNVSTSTIGVNGERVITEIIVDGFIDGEWEADLCDSFKIGDEIGEPWISLDKVRLLENK